jgi:hypothetical protein
MPCFQTLLPCAPIPNQIIHIHMNHGRRRHPYPLLLSPNPIQSHIRRSIKSSIQKFASQGPISSQAITRCWMERSTNPTITVGIECFGYEL